MMNDDWMEGIQDIFLRHLAPCMQFYDAREGSEMATQWEEAYKAYEEEVLAFAKKVVKNERHLLQMSSVQGQGYETVLDNFVPKVKMYLRYGMANHAGHWHSSTRAPFLCPGFIVELVTWLNGLGVGTQEVSRLFSQMRFAKL
jgi:hypothetical protein